MDRRWRWLALAVIVPAATLDEAPTSITQPFVPCP
jgi:hypothetical protein